MKPREIVEDPAVGASLPARGRGLKRVGSLQRLRGGASLPARGRGLKRHKVNHVVYASSSRSPRGGVD